jgi:Dolichyl-phosphate-mannose-protein mannosyltransferase
VLAAALVVAAVLLAVSGGVRANVGGFRVSAQSPVPALVASVVLASVWLALAWRQAQVAADLASMGLAVERRAGAMVIVCALASGVAAQAFATNSASGADASGYLSQAAMWSQQHLFVFDRLSAELTAALPMDTYPTTPLGWRAHGAGMQVPSYPPGLPLLMALPHRIAGTRGAALLIPISTFIAVWTVGALSRTLAGGAAGVVAAIVMAVTPVFLFQSVQPMSDVPVTAAWMLSWWAIVRRRKNSALWAGLACAAAVLIRPNLAPLATVPFLAILLSSRRDAVRFALPVAAAGCLLAMLQLIWYGSALRSGYGGVDELFVLSNVPMNLSHYLGWLIDTSPALVTAVGGFWILRARRDPQAMATFAVFVVAAYLAYAVFEDWSYLRFLLPAMAVAAVFVGVLFQSLVDRMTPAARPVALLVMVLAVMAHGLVEARARDTFKLAGQQRRVGDIAASLGDRMSASDVILAGEQSGSMRYYTGHDIVRWEELRAEDWDRVVAALATVDRAPWIVLDAFEEPLFRANFGSHPAGMLDWPPAIDAGDTHRTRAWKLEDRARFLAGQAVPTARIH